MNQSVGQDVHQQFEAPTMGLSIRDMTVAYKRRPVLWDVSLDIPSGIRVAIVGPNGGGKSTLLKSVLNLIPRVSGVVKFFGRNYEELNDRVAYVPQRESVDWDFPVTALDVVSMGLYREIGWFRRVTRAHRARALEALTRIGLQDLAHRQIGNLSGGQQQRVFIARALIQRADFYLMDEPFAAIDAATEETLVRLLAELKEEGKTSLVVHHDLHTVAQYFDWVIMINARVVAYGPVAGTLTPENLRKTYGGRLTILEEAGRVLGDR
jgi:manganese/zinc/iron transport system ATP- binding protein